MRVRIDKRAWKALERRLSAVDQARVKVGVVGAAAEADHGDGISTGELAAIHEFGAPGANIPERSFIRRTFLTKRTEIAAVCAKLAKGIVAGKIEPERALNVLGAFCSTEVKKTITEGAGVPPPLQPETIARKGSDRPLVDTGRLLNAISWELE